MLRRVCAAPRCGFSTTAPTLSKARRANKQKKELERGAITVTVGDLNALRTMDRSNVLQRAFEALKYGKGAQIKALRKAKIYLDKGVSKGYDWALDEAAPTYTQLAKEEDNPEEQARLEGLAKRYTVASIATAEARLKRCQLLLLGGQEMRSAELSSLATFLHNDAMEAYEGGGEGGGSVFADDCLQASAAAGDNEARLLLATLYSGGAKAVGIPSNIASNPEHAYLVARAAAKDGSAEAMVIVGSMYMLASENPSAFPHIPSTPQGYVVRAFRYFKSASLEPGNELHHRQARVLVEDMAATAAEVERLGGLDGDWEDSLG